MKYGLTDDEYHYILKAVVEPLNQQGAKVYCYGSRARGDYKKFSDLDLMVESAQDVGKVISDIKEALVESSFPYKVDLVQLSEFAESYKQGYFKDRKPF